MFNDGLSTLIQANKLCDMYREQCLTLEEEVCRLKEENDVSRSMFKDRASQMSKRLTTMNSRYEALEARRNLEMEGYKTDVQLLRKKVHDMEKHMIKVCWEFDAVWICCLNFKVTSSSIGSCLNLPLRTCSW